MKNELVISFMHANYLVNSYGTEKFVRELSGEMKKHNIHHLSFFSMFHNYGKKSVGITYDDQYKGIYEYYSIDSIINNYLMKYNMEKCTIHIHNFLNHDLSYLERIIKKYDIEVCIIVHDFYILCDNYKLIHSNGTFCGEKAPNEKKCIDCEFRLNGIQHYIRMKQFFKGISSQLKNIICPSDYVKSIVVSAYPEYKSRIIQRPHLKFEGYLQRDNIHNQIKIGYAGIQVVDKGFEDWKKLVSELNKNPISDYSFYYFGTGKEKMDKVKSVYVSSVEQGENAMVEAIKREALDIVFMWTQCPETYSYVYYEMSINGVYVLTNKKSGNIQQEIYKNRNGMVFDSYLDCLNYLEDVDVVKHDINKYRAEDNFHPLTMRFNDEIDMLRSSKSLNVALDRRIKVKKQFFKTLLYYLKHTKCLKSR